MRNHLVCTGCVELGKLTQETQSRLEQTKANWLEFAPDPPSLVVQHVQPDNLPPLREIAGELFALLSEISEEERGRMPGGALYYRDEHNGQYVRLKVLKGGFLTVSWAHPDYEHAQWERYEGQTVAAVFEPYQRLNGRVILDGSSAAAEELTDILEHSLGQYSQGDYTITSTVDGVEIAFQDVNADVVGLVRVMRELAKPGSLQGDIDVSSFRAGDLEDYCRFVFRAGEAWVVRPSLWADLPEPQAPQPPLERAA
jgi:hypothetical protein